MTQTQLDKIPRGAANLGESLKAGLIAGLVSAGVNNKSERKGTVSQVQSNKFVRATTTTEVITGSMKKVDVSGTQVLIANVKGTYCAVNNICPHAGASLAEGNLKDNIVTCPRHGAQFNVQTGAAVGKAKVFVFRKMSQDLECYEVKIEGTDIMVRTNTIEIASL